MGLWFSPNLCLPNMHKGVNSSIYLDCLQVVYVFFYVNFVVVMFSNLLPCDVRMSLFFCVLWTKFQGLYVTSEGDSYPHIISIYIIM